MLKPNDIDDSCDLAKPFIKHGGPSHVPGSAPQFFSGWRGLQSLPNQKEVANNYKGKELEVKEKVVVEVERRPLLYARVLGRYQQYLRSETLNHTSVVEQPAHFRQDDHCSWIRLMTSTTTCLKR